MSRSPIRLLLAGVFALAAGAFVLSGREAPEAAAVAEAPPAPTKPALLAVVDSILPGEPATAVVERIGLAADEAVRLFTDLQHLNPRRLRPGMLVEAAVDPLAGVREIAFRLAVDSVVRFTRDDVEGWIETKETLPWTTDTVAVGGRVESTLTGALVAGAIAIPREKRTALAYTIADVLEYRLDLSRDLRVGDTIAALVERQTAPGGHVKLGDVLAISGTLGGTTLEAVRFRDSRGDVTFYDAEGRSLRGAFLRAPLQFSRISSVYGGRRHPILKTWRKHTGVDYAAARGTPVRALGNGTVVFAGTKGGYGRTVEIRHANGMITRYAHLNGYANGIRRGARVGIGNTIGFVGSSGLATGPHLHFETLVGGTHKDPSKVLANMGGEPLPAADRDAFRRHRLALVGDLEARVLALQQGVGLPGDSSLRFVLPTTDARRGAVGAGN